MDKFMVNHINKGTYDFLKKTVRNNTFSLNNTERAIQRMIHNSFSYLKDLQLAYTNIPKFLNFSNDDLIVEDDMHPHLYINKDFIDVNKREDYRRNGTRFNYASDNELLPNYKWFSDNSNMYNKYITISDIISNSRIFNWFPVVLRDGCVDYNVEFKFCIDNSVDIKFNSFAKDPNFISTNHRFDVIWFKHTTDKIHVVNTTASNLSNNFTTNKFKSTDVVFAVIAPKSSNLSGSNICTCQVINNTAVKFYDSINVYKNALGNNQVSIYFFSPTNMRMISGTKSAVDINGIKKIILAIENGNNNETYDEPIPKENILAFRLINGTSYLDLDINITEHYPNIYELESDDVNNSNFRLFYLYQVLPDDFKYENKLKYVYNYLISHLTPQNSSTPISLESCIIKCLTDGSLDDDIYEKFNMCWNFKDKKWTYNNLDFWLSDESISKDFYIRNFGNNNDIYNSNKMRDYDFLYKIGKMQSIVDDDFTAMEKYGLETNIPFESYLFALNDGSIDFSSRLRNDTYTYDYPAGEEIPSQNIITFSKPHYLFKIRNDDSSKLCLDIFIDGRHIPRTVDDMEYGFKIVQHTFMDYIYIPTDAFRYDTNGIMTSRTLEIEKLTNYKFTQKQYFTNTTDLVDVTFNKKECVNPTLFDLFIVDEDNNRLSWVYNDTETLRFDVYVKIADDAQYAVPDHIFSSLDVIQDSVTGEYYITVNDLLLEFEKAYKSLDVQEALDLLPLKYINLEKIKIRCKDSTLINKKLKILINKNPYTFTKKMPQGGIPKIKLYQGKLLWRGMNSYIRTFVSGYYKPVNYTIDEVSPTEIYLLPKIKVEENDIITFEIAPYSYEMEFYIKDIPENKIIDFGDKLSRPFNFKYYDAYVNGRKISSRNVLMLTPTKLLILDIDDIYNFAVFRRDKDYEYYISTNTLTPTDSVADDESTKKKKGKDDDPPKDDPTDDEKEKDEWDDIINQHDYQYYMFYLMKIIPRGVTKGNDWNLSKEEMTTNYPIVYNNFSNKINRLVMQPNKDYKCKDVLMIGQKTNLTIPDVGFIVEDE